MQNVDMKPCLNCKGRILGCHSNCERYAKYKTELDRINSIKRKQKDIDWYFDERTRAIKRKIK